MYGGLAVWPGAAYGRLKSEFTLPRHQWSEEALEKEAVIW